jgi:hypothetical protein
MITIRYGAKPVGHKLWRPFIYAGSHERTFKKAYRDELEARLVAIKWAKHEYPGAQLMGSPQL